VSRKKYYGLKIYVVGEKFITCLFPLRLRAVSNIIINNLISIFGIKTSVGKPEPGLRNPKMVLKI
jgi:hypothetical protein